MNESKPDDLLAAEYVLGTLRGGARHRFEQQIANNPALVREVAAWQQAFAHLDLNDEPVQPPARVWQAISERLSRDAAQAARNEDTFNQAHYPDTQESSAPPRFDMARKVKIWQMTSAALAACLVVALFWPDSVGRRDDAALVRPIAVLSSTTPNSVSHLIAGYDARQRSLMFTPLNVTTTDAQHSLQLWRIGADKKPVSLGLLDPGKRTRIDYETLSTLEGMTLAVSLEPAGGSPTGQPTGAVLYAGVVALASNAPGK
ncbi:hypothetical protein W822_05330 [Advenella kashmirensis W13003]|uniref:Anti-sigma K factor RskA C-terminal domain-containing protein n=1 Tax=Advenella kashmirensis W13003 TaxID=1424334 RepID=V8QZ31_9BURK|nr:anti-sigma factor [Advenella kashmirensis]ETF04565.1 hypothetical protein W822_05330 [Advenella kashmirensis W13003]